MEKLKNLIYSVYYLPENLIYSVKYLPQILFFGSIGILFYAFFIVGIENLAPFVKSIFLPFLLFFLYITFSAMKNYRTKREFGGKSISTVRAENVIGGWDWLGFFSFVLIAIFSLYKYFND